jgi:hypothetical protein
MQPDYPDKQCYNNADQACYLGRLPIEEIILSDKLKKYYKELTVFVAFLILTAILTYPLILHFSSSVYGYPWPGDQTGTIWHFWWLKYALQHNLSPYFTPLLAAPFGASLPVQYLLWNYTVIALSFLFNEVFVYNLLIFISFPLTAFAMYLLAYYITKNRVASFVAGLIFAFLPYHIMRAQGHLTLAHMQWMPLYVLSLLMLDREKTYRNGVFCGLAFALVVLGDLYYGFFMFIFTALFFGFKGIHWLIVSRKLKIDLGTIAVYLLTAGLAGVIILGFNLSLFKRSGDASVQQRVHPLSELIVYSARPLEYLVPPISNPLFRKYTEPFINANVHGSNVGEQTLFLGYGPILLALAGIAYTWRKRKTAANGKQQQLTVGFFSFAALAALIFSAPPYANVGPIKLYFPSYFLYGFLPMFRCYSRWGVVVAMCITVLAAVGLDYLLKSLSSSRTKGLLVSAIILVLSIEFAFSPQIMYLGSPLPVYEWMKKQKGDFIIAEYPLVVSENVINYDYMFSQRIHRKRIVNGSSAYTLAEEWRINLRDISDRRVPGLLSYLKVKYIIFHPDKYAGEGREVPQMSRSGLKLARTFGETRVYEVTAKPAELIVTPAGNFDKLENWDDKDWRWMSNDGKVSVTNRSTKRMRTTLSFKAISFQEPRMLNVEINGRIVERIRVPSSRAKVYKINNIVLLPGKSKIELKADPDAVAIDSVLHNYDMRKVSVAFDWLELTQEKGR